MESNQQDPKKKKNPNISAPKNFLIPILLLHLREWNSHGYELMEKLAQFGIDSLDHGNFYRLLRQLEKDSLVTSVWDTTSGGPAKRIYSITEVGEQYLDLWAGSLSEYQRMLNQFFNLYNPFYSPRPSSISSKKKEEKAEKIATEPKPSINEEKSSTEVAATTAKNLATANVTKPTTKKPATRRTTKARAQRTTKPKVMTTPDTPGKN